MSIHSNFNNKTNKANIIHLLDEEQRQVSKNTNILQKQKCGEFIINKDFKKIKDIIEIPIEMEDGKIEKILIKGNQNPKIIANQFCKKHQLSEGLASIFKPVAIKKIQEAQKILDKNVNKHNFNYDSDNNITFNADKAENDDNNNNNIDEDEDDDEIQEDEQKINSICRHSELVQNNNDSLKFNSQSKSEFNSKSQSKFEYKSKAKLKSKSKSKSKLESKSTLQKAKSFKLLTTLSNNFKSNNDNNFHEIKTKNEEKNKNKNKNEIKGEIIFASSHFGEEYNFEKVQEENPITQNNHNYNYNYNYNLMMTCDSIKKDKEFREIEKNQQVIII